MLNGELGGAPGCGDAGGRGDTDGVGLVFNDCDAGLVAACGCAVSGILADPDNGATFKLL